MTATEQVKRLLEILLEHPQEIEAKTNRYYALTLKEQELQRQKQRIEQEAYTQIHNEETPDGKKAYSNEAIRTAELQRRISLSEEYQALRDEETVVFLSKHEAQANIDRLKREHRGAVAAVNILNSKIEEQE